MNIMAKLSLALFAALLASPAWAGTSLPSVRAAQQSAAPASASSPAVQSQAFEAWTLECLEGQPAATCRVSTSITVQTPTGERAVAAAIGLRPVTGTDRMQISVQVPVGVMLQPGVTLSGPDGAAIARLSFVVCSPQACEAGAVLDAAQLQGLLAAAERATAQYVLAGDQQARLDFSMKGFAPAVAALKAR